MIAWLLAAASPSPTPAPPAALACLAKWYPVTPRLDAGGWVALLPDGTVIPYDDGKTKSFDETLTAPDVEDASSIPYVTGPIVPVTVENHDPGRIRLDEVFRATYGHTESEVELATVTLLGQKLSVHVRTKTNFERLGMRLDALVAKDPSLKPYLTRLGGTFVWRPIANTPRQSSHSYGISLDVNPAYGDYWEWQKDKGGVHWRNRIPQAIVDAFEAEGFVWGGRWYHYDTMHFEYRPELLDPDCR
jgi:hypothetical protein